MSRAFRENARAAPRSPRPMDWATPISAPTLPRRTKPTDSQRYSPAAPDAATASLPTRPSQNMSVRLYAIWMNWVPMIGAATRRSFERMPPSVRSRDDAMGRG